MRLKEYYHIEFTAGVLDVTEHGRHVVNQPFNSETGNKFKDQDEATAWLLRNYPEFFTP